MSIKPRHSGRFAGERNPVSQESDEEQAQEPVIDNDLPTDNASSDESNEPVDSQSPSDSSVDIDESKFLEFYKKRTGRDISDFSELEKETAKPSRSYDEETEKFLRFQEVKGGTMQDWIELNKDWSKVDDIEVLRIKEREDIGIDLSDNEIDSLIRDKYGIDEMDDFSDLEGVALAKIKADANKFRKSKISSKEELLKSLDDPEGNSQPDSEMVTLSNGMQVRKEEYLAQRQEYEQGRAAAIEALNQASFSFKISTEDGEKEIKLDYSYTNDDKQKMLSKSEDTGRILQDFIDENNKLKHGEFNEGLLWADKKHRETVLIPRLLAQAFSMGIDNEIAEERNVNFDKPRPVNTSGKKRQIDISKIPGRQVFASRFKLNKKNN